MHGQIGDKLLSLTALEKVMSNDALISCLYGIYEKGHTWTTTAVTAPAVLCYGWRRIYASSVQMWQCLQSLVSQQQLCFLHGNQLKTSTRSLPDWVNLTQHCWWTSSSPLEIGIECTCSYQMCMSWIILLRLYMYWLPVGFFKLN